MAPAQISVLLSQKPRTENGHFCDVVLRLDLTMASLAVPVFLPADTRASRAHACAATGRRLRQRQSQTGAGLSITVQVSVDVERNNAASRWVIEKPRGCALALFCFNNSRVHSLQSIITSPLRLTQATTVFDKLLRCLQNPKNTNSHCVGTGGH